MTNKWTKNKIQSTADNTYQYNKHTKRRKSDNTYWRQTIYDIVHTQQYRSHIEKKDEETMCGPAKGLNVVKVIHTWLYLKRIYLLEVKK